MAIDIAELKKLSNLYLTPQEEKVLNKEIQEILHWTESLKDMSWEEETCTLPKAPIGQVPSREDIPCLEEGVNEILENAPKKKDGCFVVPLVVGEH
jgi:aspartyl-tRNA(Asn)/glutamyl-tRNA(Gln) amidotransferase subunit C